MGGATTEISAATTNVLIEAANFDPISIARTARRHKLPSEASRRFERGVDPAVAAPAAARVVQLLVELAGGTADALGSDYDAQRPRRSPIRLADGYVAGHRRRGLHRRRGARRARGPIGAHGRVGAAADCSSPRRAGGRDLPTRPTSPKRSPASSATTASRRCCPVAPPGRGLTRSQRLRRSVGHSAGRRRPHRGARLPVRRRGEQRPVRRRVAAPPPRSRSPTRWTPPRRSCAPRCSPASSRSPGATSPAGSTDLAIFELGSVFRPEPARTTAADRCRPATSRPDPATLAELQSGIPPQPLHVARPVPRQRRGEAAGPDADRGIDDGCAPRRSARSRPPSAVSIEVAQGQHQALHPGRTAAVERRRGASSASPANCCRRSRTSSTCPRRVVVVELDLDCSSTSPRARSSPRRSRVFPPRRRTCRSWSRRGARRRCAGCGGEGAGELLGKRAARRRLPRPGRRRLARSRSPSRCGSGAATAR